MGILKLEEIITATGGNVICCSSDTFTGVSIDSRTIKPGELFIALRGKRFDGHDFIDEALKVGSAAIVNKVESIKGKTIIYVKDTLRALHDIARYMRLKRNIPVISIGGSNGKTTTKELIASILSKKYRVLKNEGNLNNYIGLPLTLTRITDTDEVAALEMGANKPQDIKELCEIAFPHFGVLTNIGPSHLEGFKDMETLRKTELEVLDYIEVAIANADDPFLMEGIQLYKYKGSLVRYGIKNYFDVYATDIRFYERNLRFTINIGSRNIEVCPKISGRFNIYNILASVSTAYLFGVDLADIKDAVDSFTGVTMRFEIKEVNGIQVINDAYNANPASMEEAINELVRIKRGRAIAVLGDMLELGPYEEEFHRRIVRKMSELPIDIFIAVGPLMSSASKEFSRHFINAEDSLQARKILLDIWREGDTVLIKGSRGMNMEKVIETHVI